MSSDLAQYRFRHLRIGGYRRMLDVDLELRPLTVLIGANGCGKTSFLECWQLLAASCAGRLAAKLADLGGMIDLLTRDRADRLSFQLNMSVPEHEPLAYHVEIEPRAQSHGIVAEELTQRRGGFGVNAPPFKHIEAVGPDVRYFNTDDKRLLRPNWEYNPFETALSQVPKMFREPEAFRQRLASTTSYAALNVAPKAPVRTPQPLVPASHPGDNGENLVSFLYSLRETDPDRFEVYSDTLAAAFQESFERLDFPPVAAGMLAMTWKDKRFSRPLYMHQLSEGTLRFMWLAALLSSRSLSAVTLIDEPEVSLHPELISLLVDLMREAAQRTQLFVATHSDRLIRFLKPEEVLVVDIEDGVSKLTWADAMDLDQWLADYSLDELREMGRLGGRA